jgi:hypothetical protein
LRSHAAGETTPKGWRPSSYVEIRTVFIDLSIPSRAAPAVSETAGFSVNAGYRFEAGARVVLGVQRSIYENRAGLNTAANGQRRLGGAGSKPRPLGEGGYREASGVAYFPTGTHNLSVAN